MLMFFWVRVMDVVVRLFVRFSVRVILRVVCFGVDGLCGVM